MWWRVYGRSDVGCERLWETDKTVETDGLTVVGRVSRVSEPRYPCYKNVYAEHDEQFPSDPSEQLRAATVGGGEGGVYLVLLPVHTNIHSTNPVNDPPFEETRAARTLVTVSIATP